MISVPGSFFGCKNLQQIRCQSTSADLLVKLVVKSYVKLNPECEINPSEIPGENNPYYKVDNYRKFTNKKGVLPPSGTEP